MEASYFQSSYFFNCFVGKSVPSCQSSLRLSHHEIALLLSTQKNLCLFCWMIDCIFGEFTMIQYVPLTISNRRLWDLTIICHACEACRAYVWPSCWVCSPLPGIAPPVFLSRGLHPTHGTVPEGNIYCKAMKIVLQGGYTLKSITDLFSSTSVGVRQVIMKLLTGSIGHRWWRGMRDQRH